MTKSEADPNSLFAQKVLAVDFDGVIMKQCIWQGQEDTRGEPVSLGQMAHELDQLKKAGWKIIVWSARSKTPLIMQWLIDHGVDNLFDAINNNPWAPENLRSARKIPATAYLDDRSVEFDGMWLLMADRIKNFKPYWEN